MTIPLLALLGFASWTHLVLALGVGIHRWRHILTGRAQIKDFRADASNAADLYGRATRAHLNCVENLPVYAAIAIVAHLTGVGGPAMNALAIATLAARIVQTSVHVGFPLTNLSVSVRFAFFSVQLVSMSAMTVLTLTP